ncbi:MAG: hypothetical protein EOP49_37200, partial [Sphingobacteriales bacterium]
HGHQRVVVGNQHPGVLHQFAVGHDVAKGGVLHHNDQLRHQRRNDVAKGLRKDDDEENLNQRYYEQIKAAISADEDTLTFILVADTQRRYDETQDFVDKVNSMPEIDFVLHGGDLTDFGIQQEYHWQHNILEKMRVPYITVIGNHDCLGNGVKVYEHMYGPQDFVYDIGRSRFVFMNTNSLEFDEDPVPRLPFLANAFGDTSEYDNAFILAHVPPYDNEFDDSKEQDFAALLRGKKVRYALFGHQHNYKEQQPYNDGITYLATDDIADRNFIKITLQGTTVNFERIYF